jgi:polysaccharide pyruvyl transferase WcaK-like protein
LFLTRANRRNKIGLLGPYSFGNLGNAALQQALVQQINQTFPGSEIYGCCIDPVTNRGEGGVLPFPLTRHIQIEKTAPSLSGAADQSSATPAQQNRKNSLKRIPLVHPLYRLAHAIGSKCKNIAQECAFLWRAYKLARNFRMLIVGLGGVIDEAWNGPWGDAFSIFEWALIARIARTPFMFLSVGVEKLETPLTRFFVGQSLRLASYRSFRDQASKQKVESLEVPGPNFVFPDLAFSLDTPIRTEAVPAHAPSRLVGVSPMAYCDPRVWPVKDPSAYERYLTTLSHLVLRLLRENYQVALVVTQIRMDRAPLRELKEMVLKEVSAAGSERLTEPHIQTVAQFLSFASQLDFFVSSRLHGVVLPFLVNTPVLAYSHSGKIDALMDDMGLAQYCVSIDCNDVDLLSQRIGIIESNQQILREQIQQKVSQYRASLKKQYDQLLPP